MKRRKNRIAAAMLALACVFGLTAMGGCGRSEDSDISDAEDAENVENMTVDTEKIGADVILAEEYPDEGETIRDAGEVKTVTISATGDCTLGVIEDQDYSGSFVAYYDSYGEDYFFDDVRDIFEADDFTLVNLECALTTSEELEEKDFNMKGSPEYVGILTGSSVEACSLGNNHTYDYGEDGFLETREVLDDAGITYAWLDEPGLYLTDDGVRVGIVSASLLDESGQKVETLQSQIRSLKDDGAGIVIACCHWGNESEHYPTEFQQETAHALVDAGADLIVGNHPHVLQGMEVYDGRVICYSLGNFCFGGNVNPADKDTVIYQQTFIISGGEVLTDVVDARIIPCRISSADDYNDYRPTVAYGDQKEDIIGLVNAYSEPFGTENFDEEGNLIYVD